MRKRGRKLLSRVCCFFGIHNEKVTSNTYGIWSKDNNHELHKLYCTDCGKLLETSEWS